LLLSNIIIVIIWESTDQPVLQETRFNSEISIIRGNIIISLDCVFLFNCILSCYIIFYLI